MPYRLGRLIDHIGFRVSDYPAARAIWLALFEALREPGSTMADAGFIILAFFTLFGVVFLHELGHSLTAQAFGIQVLDITFWPLGGMARMAELLRQGFGR